MVRAGKLPCIRVVADIYAATRADWDPSRPMGARFDELPRFEEFIPQLHAGEG